MTSARRVTHILNLNDRDFFVVPVHSDSDLEKKKSVMNGNFCLADFNEDPEFNDIPHLFLQESEDQHQEWILPQGVPTDKDHQKKLVRAGNRVGKDKVGRHT